MSFEVGDAKDVTKLTLAPEAGSACAKWADGKFVKMTLSGWSEKAGNDSNATGAKSLAAAVAAGALAVAATQF